MKDNEIVRLFYSGLSLRQLAAKVYDEENVNKPRKERITKKDAALSVQTAIYNHVMSLFGGAGNKRKGGSHET